MLDRFTYYPCKASAGELMRKLFGALLIALIVCAIGTTMVVAMEDVRVAGSTTVLPLAEGGAEVFNAEQSDYRVTVTGGGTGVGMKNIAEGNLRDSHGLFERSLMRSGRSSETSSRRTSSAMMG